MTVSEHFIIIINRPLTDKEKEFIKLHDDLELLMAKPATEATQ